jgi:hypothetical protein
MTTFTNESGTKSVRITQEFTGIIRAAYFQIYNNEEQVLLFKSFNSIKQAEKWAFNILGI